MACLFLFLSALLAVKGLNDYGTVAVAKLKVGQKVISSGFQQLPAADLKERPLFSFTQEKGKFYSIAIVDNKGGPGGISQKQEFANYLVINVRGEVGTIAESDTIVEYMGPLPSEGENREVELVVIEQQAWISPSDFQALPSADNNLQSVLARRGYNFGVLNDPSKSKRVAANTFVAVFDRHARTALHNLQYQVQQLQQKQGQDTYQSQQGGAAAAPAASGDALFVLSRYPDPNNAQQALPVWMESQITLRATQMSQPRVDWNAAIGKLYTVLMVQDSSTGTPETPWLHWLIVDVPDTTILSQGRTICPYGPPEPVPGTPRDHYLVVVFEQTGPAPASNPFLNSFHDPSSRVEFNPEVLKDFLNPAVRGSNAFYVAAADPNPTVALAESKAGEEWASGELARLGVDPGTFGQGARAMKMEL